MKKTTQARVSNMLDPFVKLGRGLEYPLIIQRGKGRNAEFIAGVHFADKPTRRELRQWRDAIQRGIVHRAPGTVSRCLRRLVMRRSKGKDVKTEQEKLEEAVDSFAFAMKERLIEKMMQGYTGWDKTNVQPSDETLADSIVEDANYLRRQIQEGLTPSTVTMCDIANRLMMVFYRHNQHVSREAR